MRFFRSESPLVWGELDLPVLGLTRDWHGRALNPPMGFAVATDTTNLWFLATRDAPAICRPGAEPGAFTEGLWEWDVAEFFLADQASGTYLEFNLAPNGAWWAAKFTAPRVRAKSQPDFQYVVTSHSQEKTGNAWCAAISMPLDFLVCEISLGAHTTANVTAILNSPHQTFHSASKLPSLKPDFHQPEAFPRLIPSQI